MIRFSNLFCGVSAAILGVPPRDCLPFCWLLGVPIDMRLCVATWDRFLGNLFSEDFLAEGLGLEILISGVLAATFLAGVLALPIFLVITMVAGDAACPVDMEDFRTFLGVLDPFTGLDFLRTLETAVTVALETFDFLGVLPKFFLTISDQSVIFLTDLAS